MSDIPVTIIGAGPAGTTMALLLSRFGVRSVILERRTERSDHPRAHYLNIRTSELFWQWGVRESLLAEAFPSDHLPSRILEMIGGASQAERRAISPSDTISVAQDIVEAALAKQLETFGLCEIRWGAEFVSLNDQGDSVTVTYRTAEGALETITSRWCVGADGANSPVRTQLGVPMIGDPMLDRVMNIYFFGQISAPGDPPQIGYGSRDRELPGAFISMDGKERFCFHYLLSDGQSIDDYTLEQCEELVRRAGRVAPDQPIDVRAVKPWTMTALVADRYRVGSVFLAGDAAHAFPPSGGFGLNSGVGDVHNLAWKMVAVLNGQASSTLLESYEAERQPVAFLNTAQSFRNSLTMNLRGVPKPFNVTDETLAEIERRATKSVRSTAADTPDGDARRAVEMLEHGGALGQDLGYAYDQSPTIVTDGEPLTALPIHKYIPSATPGVRAPHLWMNGPDGRVSTLQLFDRSFVLLHREDGQAWSQAARDLGIAVVAVGPDQPWQVESGDFGTTYGIEADGAVLVRPDGHVAFRARSAPSDIAGVLQQAFDTALGNSQGVRAAA
jgi:putative polyketide hydroxylase